MITRITCLLTLSIFSTLMAAEDFTSARHCPNDHILEYPVTSPKNVSEQTRLSADKLERTAEKFIKLTGHSQLQQSHRRIDADQLLYNENKHSITAEGHIRFNDGKIQTVGDRLHVFLDNDSGTLDNMDFTLLGNDARGHAQTINLLNRQQTDSRHTQYTHCPPGNQDWAIDSERLFIDYKKNRITATNSWLSFKEWPLAYSPWLSFPIDDEGSGFLMPRISRSGREGLDWAMPWYWRADSHRDVTLTPRFIEHRGSLLESEFRFLNPTGQGKIELDYLAHDRLEQNRLRWRNLFEYTGTWGNTIHHQLFWSALSDEDYLNDFNNDFDTDSATSLRRFINLSSSGDFWRIQLTAEDFQPLTVLAPGQQAIHRSPEITWQLWDSQNNARLQSHLDLSHTYFNHADTERSGLRQAALLSLRYALSNHPGVLLNSHLQLRHAVQSFWQTTDDPVLDSPSIQKEHSRNSVPLFSLHSGLIFEREYFLTKNTYRHELKPELFFHYVPYQDQSAFRNYDTTEPEFSFSSLTKANRFNGLDRVGDTRQLNLLLTSDWIEQSTSTEQLTFRLGQAWYANTRQVGLNQSNSHLNTIKSNLLSDISWRNAVMEAQILAIWDEETFHNLQDDTTTQPEPTEKLSKENNLHNATLRLSYTPTTKRTFNYTHQRNANATVNNRLDFDWHMTGPWHIQGTWQQQINLKGFIAKPKTPLEVALQTLNTKFATPVTEEQPTSHHQNLNTELAIAYTSCCWGTRLKVSHYLSGKYQLPTYNVFLELELKGLGALEQRMPKNLF
jgi:LPS-assembly protein